MAHQFSICHCNISGTAYFFGYGGGFLYNIFDATHLDGGNSGLDERLTISKKKALKGLTKAANVFDNLNYPDPTRADEIKSYIRFVKKAANDSQFHVHFS